MYSVDLQPPLSQSEVAIKVDDFVHDVLSTQALAYEILPGEAKRPRPLRLERYVRHLRNMLDLFNGWSDYDFSEHLELFNDSRLDIGLCDVGTHFTCPNPYDSHRYLSEAESINLLIERIRANGSDGRYIRRKYDRTHQSKTQSVELEDYVSGVMRRYARTLVVRVNLYYRDISQPWLKVEDVFDSRNRLARLIGRDAAFDHLSGYILRIEQSDKRGFHIHAAFFFDGSRVRGEAYRARLIGKLWEKITQGRGCWHDSGLEWRRRRGDDALRATGMFLRSDVEGARRVARYMTYLVKSSQYLRLKPKGQRAFSRGIGYRQ